MRQLRVKSHPCSQQTLRLNCVPDYSFSNEDKDPYQPGWVNQTDEDYSSTIVKAFEYQTSEALNTSVYVGDHGNYGGGGYVYELRGRLSEIQGNLSVLHQLSWIDNRTRAVIIQLTLYNPNVQLFTAVTFLAEFLSVGGVVSQARFEPIDLASKTAIIPLHQTKIFSFRFSIIIPTDLHHSLYAVHHLVNADGNSIIISFTVELFSTILVFD